MKNLTILRKSDAIKTPIEAPPDQNITRQVIRWFLITFDA